MRVALGRLLRLAGFEVTSFASGELFLESLARRLPDCLVLDVHMPGLSGFDVKTRLRAENVRSPVVFITAAGSLELGARVLESGGTCLLRKPFSRDVLIEAVNAALRSGSSGD